MNLDDIPVAARALLTHGESGCTGDWRVSRDHVAGVVSNVYRLTCEACQQSHAFSIDRLPDEAPADPTDRRSAVVPDLLEHDQEPSRG